MTRYGKELSFVKIPSKASAKYLAKKYNKSEQYIAWVLLVSVKLYWNSSETIAQILATTRPFVDDLGYISVMLH